MATIYLDTSVAINESFLKSPFVEAFLKGCAILQHTVVIPHIVLDELKGNFPKKIQEKSLSLQKVGNDLGKLIDIELPAVSIKDAATGYATWLENLIEDHKIAIVPYPDISPQELVVKSYETKKPFKESGEGYKDYIVWKTILGSINSDTTTSSFIFLTNNTKDFCETCQVGDYVLHKELAIQVADPAKKPKIYTSVKAAFDKELSPSLEGMALEDIPALENDIDSIVGEFLLDDLPQMSLYRLDGLPFNDEFSISSIGAHTVNAVNLKKVGDEVIITVNGNVEIEADGFIDKFSFYQHEDAKVNIFVIDGNWNDHVMWVSATIETPFELTMFYSTIEQEVTGREISLLDEIEDEWPYK